MSEDKYQGYRGPALEVLQRENVLVWDRVRVTTPDGIVEGIILPRSAGDDSAAKSPTISVSAKTTHILLIWAGDSLLPAYSPN